MSASISNAFNITKLNLHERNNRKGKSTNAALKRRTIDTSEVSSTRPRPNMRLKKSMLPQGVVRHSSPEKPHRMIIQSLDQPEVLYCFISAAGQPAQSSNLIVSPKDIPGELQNWTHQSIETSQMTNEDGNIIEYLSSHRAEKNQEEFQLI